MKFEPPFRVHGAGSWIASANNEHHVWAGEATVDVLRLLNAGAKALAKPKTAPVKLHSGWRKLRRVGRDYAGARLIICTQADSAHGFGIVPARFVREGEGSRLPRTISARGDGSHVSEGACLACARKGLPK